MKFPAIEKIRELLARHPFEPFRIVTRCGKRLEIIDRTKIAVTNTRVFINQVPEMMQIAVDEIVRVYQPRQLRG